MNHVYLVVRCLLSTFLASELRFLKAISQIITQRLPPSLSRPRHTKSVLFGKHPHNVALKTAEQIS